MATFSNSDRYYVYCVSYQSVFILKVVFTSFWGSRDNKKCPAFTVREQANGLFSVYKGSYPLKKDIANIPIAINIIMNKMGAWENAK